MFEHHALDALRRQQVREDEAGWSSPNNGDLCAHSSPPLYSNNQLIDLMSLTATPEIETSSGHVWGVLEGGVHVFRGIPYGTAQRFKPPRPVEPWSGVREASQFGPAAPQATTSRRPPALEAAMPACSATSDWTTSSAPSTPPQALPALAAEISGKWTKFARSGDPSWPAYDTQARATMLFDSESRVEKDPAGAQRSAWRRIHT
jgi:carboxylesterase type B